MEEQGEDAERRHHLRIPLVERRRGMLSKRQRQLVGGKQCLYGQPQEPEVTIHISQARIAPLDGRDNQSKRLQQADQR